MSTPDNTPPAVPRIPPPDDGYRAQVPYIPAPAAAEPVVVDRKSSNLTAAETFGNMLGDQAHFIRTVEGEPDVCGSDGQPWPCDAWRELSRPETDPSATVSLEQAAQVAGLSVPDFQDRMRRLPASAPQQP